MPQTSKHVWGTRQTLTILITALIGVPVLDSQQAISNSRFGKAGAYQPDCASGDQSCQAWAHYRRNHPYPYQSIQWQQLDDNRLAIILLEPPPVMTRAELDHLIRTAFGRDLQSLERLRWRMGTDGWLEDVVFTIAAGHAGTPLSDPVLRDRVAFLYLALFGTTFGGAFDAQSTTVAEAAPNLRINPHELRQWMAEPSLKWRPLPEGGSPALSWQAISAQRGAGTFAAADGSLILLTFPGDLLKKAQNSGDELDALRVPFRRFAVATDSIAGAFEAPNGAIAILGRPRTQPMAAVPPLRFETFKLLASQTSDELSQSYERGSMFAGKLFSGEYAGWDWAPIYLSDPLIDTEFGALLNTTDQLLKSWSEAGNIEYLYFTYSKPSLFPFGKTPLSVRVATETGSGSVLYNWNTAGSAVMVNAVAGKVLTARQTGALPVTYGSEMKGSRALETGKLLGDEETAYRYFAARRDPNLERVVEYTVLYQFFQALDSGTATRINRAPVQNRAIRARRDAAAVRVRATVKLLSDVQTGRVRMDARVKEEFDAKLSRFRAQNPRFTSDLQLAGIIADRFSDESVQFAATRREKLRSIADDLDSEIRGFNQSTHAYNAKVAAARLNPTAAAVLTLKAMGEALETTRADIEMKGKALDQMESDNPINAVRAILVEIAAQRRDLEDIRAPFVEAHNYEPAGAIKTPSIVVSWDSADIAAVGGHNISARTLRLEPSTAVAGISLEDTGTARVLRYNPAKAGSVEAHATELARAVEHGNVKSVAELEKIIATPAPVRNRLAALELPGGSGGVKPPETWSAKLGTRVFRERSEFVENLNGIAAKNDCCVFIAHDSDEIAFATERNPAPPPAAMTFEIRDTESISDYLAGIAKRNGTKDERAVVFFDTPEEHVQALSLEVTGGHSRTASLNEIAESLGARRSGTSGARVDGIAERDLNGEVSFLKSVADAAGSKGRQLLNRLTMREPAQTWIQAEVTRLDAPAAGRFAGDIGWDAGNDGNPAAVMVRFGKGGGNGPPIDVSVVAGFADRDLPAGQRALFAASERNLASAQAKQASLAKYAVTMRNEIRRMTQIRVKRLVIVVKEGQNRTLLSLKIPVEANPVDAAKLPV